jgi:hypothetical protein
LNMKNNHNTIEPARFRFVVHILSDEKERASCDFK